MAREPLIQWKYRRSPWRLLVACICLNRTRGTVAKPIIEEIFRRWPTPASLSGADSDELTEIIRPLGLQTARARHLIHLSRVYNPTRMPREVVESLPGCGPYAADCYQMLVLGDLRVEPDDKELRRWREWALENPPAWANHFPIRRARRIHTDGNPVQINSVDLSDSFRRFSEQWLQVGEAARRSIPRIQEWQRTFADAHWSPTIDPTPVEEVVGEALNASHERRVRFEGGPMGGRVQMIPREIETLEAPVMEGTARYQRTGIEFNQHGEMTEIFTVVG